MKINIWKETWRVIKAAKKEFFIKFLTSIAIRGILLIIPVLFSNAVNDVSKQDYAEAMFLIIMSIVITIAYRMSEGINQKTFYNLYNKLYYYYNSRGIAKTNENSAFSLSRFNLGQYTNMVTTDVDVIASFFANGVIRVVQVFELFVIYAYFWSLDIKFFLSSVAISIVVLALIPKAAKSVEDLNNSKKYELDKLTSSIHEYFKNIKDIKCFNIYDKIAPLTTKQTQKYLDENKKYNVKYYWNNQFFLLGIESFRLLAISYGIYLITHGRLEIGALLIIYNYYQKIIDTFGTILTISVEYTNLKVSLERFNHIVEFSSHNKIAAKNEECITEGKIVFDNVLYGYKNDPLLKELSFEIQPYSLTAITGKAGTGKTSIFDLLLKLNRQHEGSISIDGFDIKEIPDSEYFSKISLLRQNSSLFSMSIKDNFALVDDDPGKMFEICNRIGIHNEIVKLPKAYETIISENAVIPTQLKQMIAAARTILKGSKIMLFDDAFIGLDNEKQNRILDLLLELKKDHTIVMITHDRNVLKSAENIIVIDNKHVVESGTLNELIDLKGKYYEIFEKKHDE